MSQKNYKLSLSEFRKLVRETATEMLREQDDMDFGAGEEVGVEVDTGAEAPMGDFDSAPAAPADDDDVMDFGSEVEEEAVIATPPLESEGDVAAALDSVADIVQAAADAVADMSDEGSMALEEARKLVKKAQGILAGNARARKARDARARLAKLARK